MIPKSRQLTTAVQLQPVQSSPVSSLFAVLWTGLLNSRSGAPRQKDPVTVYFYFWPFFSLVLISAEATAWPRNCGFLLQNGHPFNSLAMILGDLQMLYET